jgi:hypothetical protein
MKGKLGSTLFALVFAIPFGGFGGVAAWGIASMFSASRGAAEWVVVQARVDEAELKVSRGSKGGSTYQATGKYSYSFGGRTYTGTRLGFDILGGSDNIGDWQADMGAFLEEAKKSGKTIPVWVNPERPEEAVVDREVRWGLVLFMGVFAVVFGGVGVGALIALVFIWTGGEKKPEGAAKPPPGERHEARVREPGSARASDAWKQQGVFWAFTLLWNLISIPIAILVVHEAIEDEEWVALLVLIFPLVGLLLLWGAISSAIGLLRRGNATIALMPERPHAGSSFSGAVSFSKGVNSGESFKVRLVCNRTIETRNSKNTAPCWSRETTAMATAGAQGARVPFRFEIPAEIGRDEPERDGRSVTHAWRIELGPARNASALSYGFDIEVQPASESTFGGDHAFGDRQAFGFGAPALAGAQPAAAAPSMGDAALAQLLGPAYAAKLTGEQRAAFAAMPAEAQAMAGKVTRNLPQIKKAIFVVVALFVVVQVLGVIAVIFASS